MKIFFLLISVLWALYSSVTFSAEEDLAPAFELRLKIASIMLSTEQKIRDEFPGGIPSGSAADVNWQSSFKQLSTDFLQQVLDANQVPQKEQSLVKKALGKLQWNQLADFARKQLHWLAKTSRAKGNSLAAAIVLSTVFQVIVPPILLHLGYPNAAWLTFYFAGNTEVIAFHHVVTSAWHYRKMSQLFGGREMYRIWKNMNKMALMELNISSMKDFIVPLFDEGDKGLALALNGGGLKKILSRLGFSPKHLTLPRLKKFCQEKGLNHAGLQGIFLHPGLSDEAKIALAVKHLFEAQDLAVTSALRLRYGDSFVSVARSTDFDYLSQWTVKAVKAQSPAELKDLILSIPPETHPQKIMELWEHIILPAYTEDGNLFEYGEFRKLYQNFHALKADLYLNDQKRMDGLITDAMLDYLGQAVGARSFRCFKSHDQVLRALFSGAH